MCAVQPQHYTNEETYFTQHSTNLIYCHFTTRTVQCVVRFSEKVNETSPNFPINHIACNQGFFIAQSICTYTVNSGRNYAHVAFLPSLFPSFIPGLFFASYLCHHQYSAIYIPSHVCVGGALRCVAPCIVCRSRRNKDLVNNKKESLRDQ